MPHRLLLADDSLTIQKVVELTFSESEYELQAVGSGDKAVEALATFLPEIVLADVVMPGLSGYEVCEAVKKLPDGAFIPVVLLTGTFEPFDRARAERVGCDSIVTKPFDSHALSSLVRDLLDKAKRAKESAPTREIPAAASVAEAAAAPVDEARTTVAVQSMGFEFATKAYEPLAAEPEPPPPAPEEPPTPPDEPPPTPPEPQPAAEVEYATMAMRIPSFDRMERPAEQETVPPWGVPADSVLPAPPPVEEELPAVTASSIEEPVPVSTPAPVSTPLRLELVEEPAPADVPPPPPLGAGEDDEDGRQDVMRRDIDDDIAAFEQHTPNLRRASPWDAYESTPPVATAAEPHGPGDLEELAARTDLSALIPESATPPVPVTALPVQAAVAGPLAEADVDRIAKRVAELLGDRVIRDLAWDIVPEMAERLIRQRLKELEEA